MTSLNTQSLTEAFHAFHAVLPDKIEFTHDPLFLSAVKHSVLHNDLMLPYDEYNRNKFPNILNLGNLYGSNSLKDLDILLSSEVCKLMVFAREQKMAADITEYYQQKYTLNALKDVQLTQFHKDVVELVTTKRKTLNSMEIGLITMLPLFYAYDINLDQIMEGKTMNPLVLSQTHKLKFLKKLTKKTKNTTEYNYFFMDSANQVYLITLDKFQKLTHFFEHFINSNEWVNIDGFTRATTHSHAHLIYQFSGKWQPIFD